MKAIRNLSCYYIELSLSFEHFYFIYRNNINSSITYSINRLNLNYKLEGKQNYKIRSDFLETRDNIFVLLIYCDLDSYLDLNFQQIDSSFLNDFFL